MTTRARVSDDTRRSELTDGELITASLSDADQFAGVFDRHWHEVHRYVTRRLGNQAAGDVAGEVFLQAFKSRAGTTRNIRTHGLGCTASRATWSASTGGPSSGS